jgi:hypothetical protein
MAVETDKVRLTRAQKEEAAGARAAAEILESSKRHIHFEVARPGFIPAGAVITGDIATSATEVIGFIPGKKPAVAEALAADPNYGICPFSGPECGDFRDKPDPAASLAAHIRIKHG